MKFKSEVVGGVITGLYLALVVALAYMNRGSFQDLGLNGVGDFLAGAFGPVAFLWLILGYLQQGKELRASSQALLAQCDQLANSAEQQRLALEISKSQMNLAHEKHQIEMIELEEAIRPRISVSFGRFGNTLNYHYYDFEFLVSNSAAYNLEVRWCYGNVEHSALTAGYIGARAKEKFQVTFGFDESPVNFEITVSCENVRGRKYSYKFTFEKSQGGCSVVAHPSSPTTIRAKASLQ